jgi:hypothetical protein
MQSQSKIGETSLPMDNCRVSSSKNGESQMPGALKISSGYGIVGEYSEKEAGHGSGKKPA